MVDAGQVGAEVEAAVQRLRREGLAELGPHHRLEPGLTAAGALGQRLDLAVGVLAGPAGDDQRVEHPGGAGDPAQGLDVLRHPVGVDADLDDEAGRDAEHVVDQSAAVGQHHPLGGGMGDVALVPEGDVLEGGQGVAAQHSGHAADALGEHRVVLVGHGRGPLLPLREGLLQLGDLGLLKQPDGGGEPLEAGTQDGHRGDEGGVAVAGQHLGGGGGDAEPEALADVLLDLGRDRGVGADRPAHLADRDLRRGGGRRARPRRTSSRWLASLTPRLRGSACTPWVRPGIMVSRWRTAWAAAPPPGRRRPRRSAAPRRAAGWPGRCRRHRRR